MDVIRILRMETILTMCGRRCQLCGYGRSRHALDFHHVEKEKKTMGLSTRFFQNKLERIAKELQSCALLCSNCHRETHAGLVDKARLRKEMRLMRTRLKSLKRKTWSDFRLAWSDAHLITPEVASKL